jgi:hypothetical protein
VEEVILKYDKEKKERKEEMYELRNVWKSVKVKSKNEIMNE